MGLDVRHTEGECKCHVVSEQKFLHRQSTVGRSRYQFTMHYFSGLLLLHIFT